MRFILLLALLALVACADRATVPLDRQTGPDPVLPAPVHSLIPTVRVPKAVGWPQGAKPVAASGWSVSAYAAGLDHPRWLYVLPNGDVLVAETNAPERHDEGQGIRGWVAKLVMKRAGAGVASADRITLLRDASAGVAEKHVFLEHLHSPFGMALIGNDLYVANTDAVLRFPYRAGETRIDAPGTKVVNLPAGELDHHWTKNLLASRDGRKLYVTVGSNSNVAENGIDAEAGRAAIWEIDLASGAHREIATGLRNPNGLDHDRAPGLYGPW